jgi:Tol biopolymer transport system component/DNA-binding winged helix-turn-helix (wHTH) protein
MALSEAGASSVRSTRNVFKSGPKCSEKTLKALREENRQVFEFDQFRLHVAKRQLLREGEVVPLYSKAFDLLLLLVRSNGRDLTKDEILDNVWPGQILEESNLTVNISAVRRALGEKASQPRYLITIPGVGYRFVAPVRDRPEAEDDLVIQHETVSQITVEEVDDARALGGAGLTVIDPETDAATVALLRPALQLPPVPSTSIVKRPWVWGLLCIALLAIVFVTFFVVRTMQQNRAAANRFQQAKLRLLTNDGRVVNAAISPDGKVFVFVRAARQKQSLELGQMNGEGPIELRPPADLVYEGLAFAPDGSSVYYVIDDHLPNKQTLYRLPILGGVPVKLREDIAAFFAIAPDNERVAFVRSDPNTRTRNIVVSDLDGSNERVLLQLPVKRELMALSLSWSPDGSIIALGAKADENQSSLGILLLHLSDGKLETLTSPQWREIQSTAWLKDGSGLAIVAATPVTQENRQIWFVALPGGQTRRITNDLTSYDISLSTTTDSNNIMAVQHQQMSNIWTAPAQDLAKAQQVTFGALNRGDGGLGLDWTPAGRIVYVSNVAQSRTIWSMDPDGANAKELTPPGYFETTPSVTGDGRSMVFESNRSGTSEIWRANIDGTDPKRLTTCGKNFQPDVTPDGKWVVYRSTCEAEPGLWRVAFDGGEPKRLTDRSGSWPWVSPDSKLVACAYAATNGKEQLAIFPIEGGSAAKIFEVPPLANFRYGIRWTMDGKAITYRDWGSGLWRQPVEGGEPNRIPDLPEEKIYSYAWSRDGKLFAFTRGVEMRDVVVISSAN